MKHVDKGASPPSFEAWKQLANDDWQPTYKSLPNPQKSELHDALLREQGWVCCYCGRSVSKEDSHIEHFRPQDSYSPLALCYENLHASCVRDMEAGTPPHCGHAKADAFDEMLHISPLDASCEARFIYAGDGQILSADTADVNAAYMLKLLKLNAPLLRLRRQEVIQAIFDAEFVQAATVADLERLRDVFRRLDDSGHAQNFGHVVARFAEQRLSD
jgi:uncharacterized protein (TIGR02646 family)